MPTKRIKKKLDGSCTRILCCFEQILKAIADKTVAVWPLASHLKNLPNKTNKICGTLLEKQRQSHGPLYIAVPVLADQQELTSALCGY